MASVILNGATSGSTTITPTDAATVTMTLPSVTGTLLTGSAQSATPYTVALGYQAANSTTGASNTAIGTQAGYSITFGNYNVAFGSEALFSSIN